jgi:predicted nucleic acid-binding protein
MALMTKKTVYVETSVVSYLTARPTANLLAAAWQKVTLDWWETQRCRFDLFTSEVTVQEAGRGDQAARAKRLEALADIPLLPITDDVGPLAAALLRGGILPEKALNDALHIAVAAAHRVDYLLTWNYRHLDNAETKPAIRDTCVRHGLTSPEICTPSELMGELEDDG